MYININYLLLEWFSMSVKTKAKGNCSKQSQRTHWDNPMNQSLLEINKGSRLSQSVGKCVQAIPSMRFASRESWKLYWSSWTWHLFWWRKLSWFSTDVSHRGDEKVAQVFLGQSWSKVMQNQLLFDTVKTVLITY